MPLCIRMKLVYTIIFLLLIPFTYLTAQTRTVKGKVITEELEKLPEVRIYNQDTTLLVTTDRTGKFEIKLPQKSDELIFSWIGMEWLTISIPRNCEQLEVILLADVIYHYKSHKKIDRLRKEQFDKRMDIHREALKKGIFKLESPCFQYKFIPQKPQLDEIRIWMNGVEKDIKNKFKELAIGDTIYVPYSGSWRSDGTDRTSLSSFSSYVEGTEFDCIIQGIVTDKNRKRNGLILKFKVANTTTCKYDFPIYDKREMKVGEIFDVNIKYFKILMTNK